MKIYGFNESDAKGLIEYLEDNSSKSKVEIFSDYANKIGKSKGTVRNLYYAIVKEKKDDEKSLFKVKNIRKFTPQDEKNLIDKVNEERKNGRSVRSIINQMTNGDNALFLRYQNKYRNYLRKNQTTIEGVKNNYKINEVQLRRLKAEINGLIERLLIKERQKNERLLARIKILETENQDLRRKFENNSIRILNKTI